MSKKRSKAVVFEAAPSSAVGGYEDARARLKHQSLAQDYVELQKEVDYLRGSVDAAKQRKLILAAEVRFLRRRYKQLMETKNPNTVHERLAQPPIIPKPTRKGKEQVLRGKEASLNGLPPMPEPKPKKRKSSGKLVITHAIPQAAAHGRKKTTFGEKIANGSGLDLFNDMNHKGRMHFTKEALALYTAPTHNDPREKMFGPNDASLRSYGVPGFDLNQDGRPVGEEGCLPRAPIFDLNQVSTGDEDFPINVEEVKFEEARKALARGINDEPQNDLMLSVCRNAGEGSSRVGKRKISWQDPVALRV